MRSYRRENGGGVVSRLTHQAEVCSLAQYKTPVKGGRGRAEGASGERGIWRGGEG